MRGLNGTAVCTMGTVPERCPSPGNRRYRALVTSDEVPAPLSIGAVTGGTTDGGAAARAVKALGLAVRSARDDVESPLSVNVVYQIAGRHLTPDFSGVRTGRYSAGNRLLLVQAAFVPDPALDPDVEARRLLQLAATEAEHWAHDHNLADSLPALRALVDLVTGR